MESEIDAINSTLRAAIAAAKLLEQVTIDAATKTCDAATKTYLKAVLIAWAARDKALLKSKNNLKKNNGKKKGE